ncbi:hypothetical protein L1887_34108 [Cichorium endivia]|nr:hypothetical protein L1887_34108 [Cichorium endivia]
MASESSLVSSLTSLAHQCRKLISGVSGTVGDTSMESDDLRSLYSPCYNKLSIDQSNKSLNITQSPWLLLQSIIELESEMATSSIHGLHD